MVCRLAADRVAAAEIHVDIDAQDRAEEPLGEQGLFEGFETGSEVPLADRLQAGDHQLVATVGGVDRERALGDDRFAFAGHGPVAGDCAAPHDDGQDGFTVFEGGVEVAAGDHPYL